MFDNFENLVLKRQSCRVYNGKKVDLETLDKILDLSRNCPSACNSQPWEMYVVTKDEDLPKMRKILQVGNVNSFLDNATAFVALVEHTPTLRADVPVPSNHFVKYDIGELIAYITLSAKALGVSTCIIGRIDKDLLKKTFLIGDDKDCNVVISFGYSDIPTRKKIRKDKKDTIIYV